jgi:hypothetical protein
VFEWPDRLPGPFRQLLGDAGPAKVNPVDKCYSLETLGTGLLELVADPGCDSYKLSAEVRHDAAGGDSLAGVFFGFREHHTAGGVRQGSFYSLTFADRGTRATALRRSDGNFYSRVMLHCHLFDERDGKPYVTHTALGKGKEFQPALPYGHPGPWRKLEVKVTPDGINAYWMNDRGLLELVQDAPAGKTLEKYLAERKKFETNFLHRDWVAIPINFSPRSGVGIYVFTGEVSFRRIMVQLMSP